MINTCGSGAENSTAVGSCSNSSRINSICVATGCPGNEGSCSAAEIDHPASAESSATCVMPDEAIDLIAAGDTSCGREVGAMIDY